MVTRFDVFVHHPNSTAITYTEMVFCICSACSTCPAELILAESASHMITAFVFLDSGTTHRTEWHIVLVFFSPASQLLVKCFFTGNFFSVPLIFTIKANPSLAFRTFQFLDFLKFWGSHVLITSCFRTIPYQRIRIKFLRLSESFIFLEKFWLIILI